MTLGQTWRQNIPFFYERREGGSGCSDLKLCIKIL